MGSVPEVLIEMVPITIYHTPRRGRFQSQDGSENVTGFQGKSRPAFLASYETSTQTTKYCAGKRARPIKYRLSFNCVMREEGEMAPTIMSKT